MSPKPLLDMGDTEWGIVQHILQWQVPEREVWAFGSRAKWTAKEFSDLDLAIIGQQPLTMEQSTALADAFAESDLPWKVDVVDWATTSESFREIIERDKVVVQPTGKKGKSGGWDMGSRVQLIRLEKVLSFANGRTSPDRTEKATIPVYGSNGLIGNTHETNSPPNTIVIGRVGSYCGSVHFSNESCWVTDNAIKATAKAENDPRFLYYLLKHLDLNNWRSGSGQPLLNQATLNSIEVPIPSPAEQRAISETVGSLDDRITLLRETNATLEAIAQAMFKSWFVDFDPVRVKLAGRAPEGMDEAMAALFPDAFEETELGVVPKGWQLVPFGDMLSHTIGGDWGSDAPDEKNDTRVAIIRGTDIPDLQSGGANRVPIRYTSAKKLTSRAIQGGDIVLEVSGGSKDQPTGRSLYMTEALLRKFECPVEPASFCRLFRPTSSGLGVLLSQHLTFIYAAGKTWEYQNQSTGIANFQTTHFLEKELVAVPDGAVLQLFESLVRPIVGRVHAAQIGELSALRDTLLPRLISGQLRLPEMMEAKVV